MDARGCIPQFIDLRGHQRRSHLRLCESALSIKRGTECSIPDVYKVAQGTQIPTNLTSDLLGTLNLLAMERTAEFKTHCGNATLSKLPSLNGLTYLQLALEQAKALNDFAIERFLFVKAGKARTEALMLFETMNNGTCATLAQDFAVPNVPTIKLSTTSLNFGKVPVSGSGL